MLASCYGSYPPFGDYSLPNSDRGQAEPSKAEPPKDDPFDTKEKREEAIRQAAKKKCCRKIDLADQLGVDYSDMRVWVRDRGIKFAKGGSVKVERIENGLPTLLVEA